MFRPTYKTKQNFIARPGNANILFGWPSRQTAPTDVQSTRNSRPAGAHRLGTKPRRAQDLRVSACGSIRNQVFSERAFSVPNN